MNVPNYLTISRILSVPLLIWILSTNVISGVHGEKELLAAAVFSWRPSQTGSTVIWRASMA